MDKERLDSLEILLEEYKEDILFELAGAYKLRGYSFYEKKELIQQIKTLIVKQASMIMGILSEEDLDILERGKENGVIAITSEIQEILQLFVGFGWGMFKDYKGDKVFVLGEEIFNMYRDQRGSVEFKEYQEMMQQLRACRNGLLNLYGIVEITWLKQLFQRDAGIEMDMRIFLEILRNMNQIYGGCQLMAYYIVHESFYCIEENDFKYFRQNSELYDYYEPTAEEIKNNENEFYYEDNQSTRSIKEYLKNHCGLGEEAAHFAVAVLNVHIRIQEDVKMVNMLQIVEEWHRLGIRVVGVKQLEGILPLVMRMMEATRMWRLRGHKPSDLGIRLLPVISKEGRVTTEKLQVGRNDLCPCGSGKKYKKCCLNKTE